MDVQNFKNDLSWKELQEMAGLLKQLSPKEKERILYMIQGVALISEAVREQTGKVGA